MSAANSTDNPPAGVFRRLGAMVYDALAMLALLYFASMPLVALQGGDAIAPGNGFYTAYLLVVAYAYFGLCWRLGGRTLGQHAWGLQVRSDSGKRMTSRESILRFCGGLLSLCAGGLGFVWPWLDKRQRSWPDLISNTRLVLMPRSRAPAQQD